MAAVIPAIATQVLPLLPGVINLITSLVHHQAPVAEVKNGPGTGPVKFADVFGFVISKLTEAATAGQIDKILPPDPVIQMIIQAVVSSMQLSGLLGEAPAATAPAVALNPVTTDRVINLQAGQTLLIQVK